MRSRRADPTVRATGAFLGLGALFSLVDPPAWLAPHLRPGERVVWAQDIAPGAYWGVAGPLVGAAFAIAFAGSAVTDMPGPFSWITDRIDVSGRLGTPGWILTIVGALSFVSLVAKHAARESLSAWAVTDRRLIHVIRHAPFLARSWSLGEVGLKRVKLRKKGARVTIQVPRPLLSFEDDVTIEARERAALLASAIPPPRRA